MRRFIIKTVLVSLPLVFMALGIEMLLRNIPNDYLCKKEYLDKHSNEIETLIVGSSHSFYGLNPAYFTRKTFNASYISQSIDYDLLLLKKYELNLKSLKTVVLPISYFTFFEQIKSGPESWRVKNYTLYYEMNTSKAIEHYAEVFSNRLDVNVKRIVLYYLLKQPTLSSTPLGWGTNFRSEEAQDLFTSGKAAAFKHTMEDLHADGCQAIFADNVAILNSMMAWCKQRNINVLLLTTPAFETYRQSLHDEQLRVSIEVAKRMASSYDHCVYLNLLSDPRFVAKDFYDADHLSEIGAVKLSKLVDHEINTRE